MILRIVAAVALVLAVPAAVAQEQPNYFASHLAQCELQLMLAQQGAELGTGSPDDGAKVEKCADDYLRWAIEYAKEHPDLVAAVKEQHLAFTALASGHKPVPGESTRARMSRLRQELDAAKRRVDMERKLAGL